MVIYHLNSEMFTFMENVMVLRYFFSILYTKDISDRESIEETKRNPTSTFSHSYADTHGSYVMELRKVQHSELTIIETCSKELVVV